jgi:hypothetical protein
LKSSTVARGNRLLERRPFANGSAWISSEFAPTAGRPDMFDLMVAAANAATAGPAAKEERPQPHPDATLVHFDLPNGFPAYFIANASGARINDIPRSVIRDDSHPSDRIAVALSCVGCHGTTAVALAPGRGDDLRARLQSEPTLSKEARERLLAMHSEPADLRHTIDEDMARMLRVMAAAGVDPNRRLDGLDIWSGLSAHYRRPVNAAELADLVDMDQNALFDIGRQSNGALADIITRLGFGPVSRAEIDAILPELAVKRGLRAAVAIAQPNTSASNPAAALEPRLILKADHTTYQSGDLLAFTARANANCYLTVLTLDARGRATVLYPNEFDANNLVEAGREVRVPGEKSPYQFRLREKGHETLIGVCSTSAKPPDGIQHNFELQRFTEIGNYKAFLNRNWGARAPTESKPAPSVKAGQRRTTEQAETTTAESQARTAIRITIQ